MEKINTIIIASQNPAKVERLRKLLVEIAANVVGLKELGVTDKPQESGETAEENAEIKGRFYAQRTGQLTFCEDESLFADFLPPNLQPGVHVRRINRVDEADDATLLKHWEELIAGIPKGKRTGHWHIAYCLAAPTGKAKVVAQDFPIVFFPTSKIHLQGWPLSGVQGSAMFGKPDSELTDDEHKIKNRGRDKLIFESLLTLLGDSRV